MRGFRFAFFMLAVLLSFVGSIHAQPLALCFSSDARVVLRGTNEVAVGIIGKDLLVGRIDYVVRGKYSRIINASCVRTDGKSGYESCDLSKMTIALIDEEPRGVLVITSKRGEPDEWSYYAGSDSCPFPTVPNLQTMNKFPTCSSADIAKIVAESDLVSSIDSTAWPIALGQDEAKLFCDENRRNAMGRIRMVQAVADFMAHRRKIKNSTRDDELNMTPQLAAELYRKCYHIRNLGVFMHGSGVMTFPQFASAGCYAGLFPIFDPGK